jgi:hypothetical protein
MQTDAFGLRTAALEVRRAALRLPLDARGPRTASLRARTDAPFIPTDALCIRSAPFVSTDGSSTSSQRRRQRSKGSSLRRMGCPTHSSGRPVRSRARSDRTSGCCHCMQGCRAKARRGFSKSHGVIAHFSSCRLYLESSGADTRSAPCHGERRVARSSGCRRWDSRRQTACPRLCRGVAYTRTGSGRYPR